VPTFQVGWTNEDVPADDPLSAAQKAWEMLRDPATTPPVFEVQTHDALSVEVDLMDDIVRPVDTRAVADHGARLLIASYLATYPHALPNLDTATAHIVRADQLRKDDVILGAFRPDNQQPGRATLGAHIPRFADPSPACGACSPDCAKFVISAEHSARTALHITAIGREVTEPEDVGADETIFLNDFTDALYLAIPHARHGRTP
jgi:hypothetical protein